MTAYDIAFCALAITHGLFGYVFFIFAMTEEIQRLAFYENANPLVGDIHKYLVYFTCGSLAACAFLLPYSYKMSTIAAWVSFGIYTLGTLVVPVLNGFWPTANKYRLTNLAIRASGASALTYLFLHTTRS